VFFRGFRGKWFDIFWFNPYEQTQELN